ncbi:unnamed protein product, partial [marine sediment metagenome]
LPTYPYNEFFIKETHLPIPAKETPHMAPYENIIFLTARYSIAIF